MDVHIGDFVGI
jgi:hypothetical protein